jgi:hypothetical protein
MKAGRELDRLVAEKVMGWKVEYGELGHEHFTENGEIKFLPFYSTNISDAWQVVEKLKLEFICKVIGLTNDHKDWFCSFTPIGLGAYGNAAYAETAPLAICLSSLKVKGVEI